MAEQEAILADKDAMTAAWRMSPAVRARGFLFLTGVTAASLPGPLSPDPESQIDAVFAEVARILACAGADFGHVVEMTSYHLDILDTLPTFRRVRDRYVTAPYPAWTAIGVSGFATAGVVAELRVIALDPSAA